MNSEEPLIHNQWIVFPGFAILASSFMARETFLIACYARNLPTDEEHLIKDDLRLRRHDRDGSFGCKIVRRRYLADREQSAARERQCALTKHARMQAARNCVATIRFSD